MRDQLGLRNELFVSRVFLLFFSPKLNLIFMNEVKVIIIRLCSLCRSETSIELQHDDLYFFSFPEGSKLADQL